MARAPPPPAALRADPAPAASFLAEGFRDAWALGGDVSGETCPSDEPTVRIDHVFVSEGVRGRARLVPADEEARLASEHRPVVAELTPPEPG